MVALSNDVLKKYYIKNISLAKITTREFSYDAKIDNLLENSISVWFDRDKEPFEVKLYANKIATKYFQRRPLPTQNVEAISRDGSMEFSVNITHEMEIIPIVKYWIPHLRVISPSWLQDMIDDDLKDYLEKQT